MKSDIKSISKYLDQIPTEWKDAFNKLRQTIIDNIPEGFSEEISYGMIGYVVPHSIYPAGYHCNPKQALPFVNLAMQKNYIALYHMGLYSNPKLLEWFNTEYQNLTKRKPDIGKSCIRFKNADKIYYELIARLMQKITVDEWIKLYEKNLKK